MNAIARRFIGPVLLCVLVYAPAALAQGGVNLAWNDCPAEGGLANLDFGCGTNTGVNQAVASFVLPADAPQVVGIYAVIDVQGEALPAWWSMQSGGCRYGALSYSTDFTAENYGASSHCFDVWQGQAIGGLDYALNYGGDPGHARFRIVAAVPGNEAKSLVAGREYYGFRMTMNNSKSSGATSCAGCTSPVTLALSLLQIAQPYGVGDFNLTAPITRNTATWQGTGGSGVTPVARRTWGQIKNLYR